MCRNHDHCMICALVTFQLTFFGNFFQILSQIYPLKMTKQKYGALVWWIKLDIVFKDLFGIGVIMWEIPEPEP